MPVRILSKTERLKTVIDGSTFYYRRPLRSERLEMQEKHTKQGRTDTDALSIDWITMALLDWDGVQDEHGEAVPYAKELVPCLPANTLNALADLLNANNGESALKNLNGSMNGSG